MTATTSIKQVAIVANLSKTGAAKLAQELTSWLVKRDVQVLDAAKVPLESVLSQIDLVISLGGDGTILSLAGKMVERQVPVLGVNMGSLGFLTEVRAEELYEELKSALSGQLELEERMMLQATVRSGDSAPLKGPQSSETAAPLKEPQSSETAQPERRFQALNDVVINREGLTRYMTIQVDIGAERATRFFGDGVIIATPTGSTAYSLSAGGPIVSPALDNLIVTPICPHASALRSLVVPGDQIVRIRVTCDQEQEKALLTADGQKDIQIDARSVVEVTRSPNRFLLVKSSKRSYFETLREKFKLPS